MSVHSLMTCFKSEEQVTLNPELAAKRRERMIQELTMSGIQLPTFVIVMRPLLMDTISAKLSFKGTILFLD